MKLSILKSCTLILCLAILPGILHAKPAELTYSSQLMTTHPAIAELVVPWGDLMEERSNGNLEITYFNPNTLVPSHELIKAAHKGVVSITLVPLAMATSMFPAATVMDLPFLFSNSRESSLAAALLLEQNQQVQKDFEDWKVLSSSTSANREIVSVRKPIRTLEDLKGLKIASNSAQTAATITALGAVPVIVPINDMYLTLQRGMADAAILPIPGMAATKVTEFAKYITICNFDNASQGFFMSKETFNSLPKDVQNVLDGISPTVNSARSGVFTDALSQQYLDLIMKNHDVEIYTLPTEERERWKVAVQPMYEDWFERAKKQGVEDPEALLEQLKTILDPYEDPIQEVKNILLENKESLGPIYPPEEFLNLPY